MGRYPEGTRVKARVTNLTDYGCFAEIEEGVEGLVHVSEMDWTNKNIHPSKVVQIGDEVEVMVLDIDEERRRISLGIKQCKENPWEAFAKYPREGREGCRQHQVDHRFRYLHRPGRRHRRPGSPVRHLLERNRRRSRASFKKGDAKWKPPSCPWTRSASVSPWASSNWSVIRSVTSWAANDKGAIVKGKVKTVDAKGATIELDGRC
jgi:small subunit ribosomal protein S1